MQLDYLARVGSIMHPAAVSRPDIAAAASILASFSASPTPEHMAFQAWHHLFDEIGFDTEQADNILECDNRQTVRLIGENNPIVKTNIRHVNISDLWLRQEHHAGRVNVTWVTTDHMEADGLTKPLPKAKFDQFISHLGMQDIRSLVKTTRTTIVLRATPKLFCLPQASPSVGKPGGGTLISLRRLKIALIVVRVRSMCV